MLGQKKIPAAIVPRFCEIEWYYFGEVELSPKSRPFAFWEGTN